MSGGTEDELARSFVVQDGETAVLVAPRTVAAGAPAASAKLRFNVSGTSAMASSTTRAVRSSVLLRSPSREVQVDRAAW